MEFNSKLPDWKIKGVNLAGELTIRQYSEFLTEIIDKNDYQRKRVSSAGKTYDLLRADLIEGCVIPPIILATSERYEAELTEPIATIMREPDSADAWGQVENVVRRAIDDRGILILDGLQRSLTIKSIIDDDYEGAAAERLENFLDHKIRIEVYAGLSKPGILYRMLTLNTGQTPMSFRHQLEILYHDYIDNNELPDGIRVVKETDTARARGDGQYKYSDVIDMFYAFNTGSPMPFNRQALVSELKEMDFLEGFTVGGGSDDMKTLLVLHNKLVQKISGLAHDWRAQTATEEDASSENVPRVERPFAPNIAAALSRTQSMTGFGAECRRLLNAKSIDGLTAVEAIINRLHFSGEPGEALDEMIVIIDQIGKRAKRIGDAQRLYFQLAFRALLQPENDNQCDLSRCWLDAQERYELLYA